MPEEANEVRYSLRDVDQFFRARLQDEARRIYATAPMTRVLETAMKKVDDVKFILVGGGRAYPNLGRVEEYRKFKGQKSFGIPSIPNGERIIELKHESPDDRYISAEDYQAICGELLRFFSYPHSHSDYDFAAVVVDNEVRNPDAVITKVIDEIKAACERPDLKSDVEEIGATLGFSWQEMISKETLRKIYDVRDGFVYKMEDLADILKTYIQLFETFKSSKDVQDVISKRADGNVVTVKFKPKLNVRVANMRRDSGGITILVEPDTGIPMYLEETLDKGGIIVGQTGAEVNNLIREVNALDPQNRERLRKQPKCWEAFVDYTKELEAEGLLTNGLFPNKARYESLASSSGGN